MTRTEGTRPPGASSWVGQGCSLSRCCLCGAWKRQPARNLGHGVLVCEKSLSMCVCLAHTHTHTPDHSPRQPPLACRALPPPLALMSALKRSSSSFAVLQCIEGRRQKLVLRQKQFDVAHPQVLQLTLHKPAANCRGRRVRVRVCASHQWQRFPSHRCGRATASTARCRSSASVAVSAVSWKADMCSLYTALRTPRNF